MKKTLCCQMNRVRHSIGRANGEIFPIEISGRLQVINGETVLLVVVRDITERKRAETRGGKHHPISHPIRGLPDTIILLIHRTTGPSLIATRRPAR